MAKDKTALATFDPTLKDLGTQKTKEVGEAIAKALDPALKDLGKQLTQLTPPPLPGSIIPPVQMPKTALAQIADTSSDQETVKRKVRPASEPSTPGIPLAPERKPAQDAPQSNPYQMAGESGIPLAPIPTAVPTNPYDVGPPQSPAAQQAQPPPPWALSLSGMNLDPADRAERQKSYGDTPNKRRMKSKAETGTEESNVADMLDQGQQMAQAAGMNQASDMLGQAGKIATHAGEAATGDPMAMAQLAGDAVNQLDEQKKRAERMTAALRNTAYGMFNEGTKGLEGGARAGESIGGLFGAGQDAVKGGEEMMRDTIPLVGGMMADAMKPLEGLYSLPKAIVESVDKLRDWNDRLFQSNARFAEYSTGMSQVVAEQEVRQIQYEQDRGEKRADSARKQAEAKHRLEVAMAPIEDAFANLANKISAELSDFATGAARSVNKILQLDEDEDEGEGGENFQQIKDLLKNTPTGQALFSSVPVLALSWLENYGLQQRQQGPGRVR